MLAWEMLTSKNPFEGKTKEVTLKKILTGKLALPSYLDSQTHSLLKGVWGAPSSIVFDLPFTCRRTFAQGPQMPIAQGDCVVSPTILTKRG